MLVFLFLVLFSIADAGKILVYSPSISISHVLMNARIADTLAEAGHDVVLFIPEFSSSASNYKGIKKAKVIHMRGIDSKYEDELEGTDAYMLAADNLSFNDRMGWEYALATMCEELLKRKDELEELRNYGFDVVFAEMLDLCGHGVLHYLGIKNILWVSTTAIIDAVSYNLGIPAPVSYVPTIEENDNGDVMSFFDRAYNLYMYLGAIYIHRKGSDMATEVLRRYISPDFPHVREIAANCSLAFVNTDEMFDLPRPIIHKNVYIGGLGYQEKPKPLDEKFEKLMSKGKEGVMVFSLGTIANFHNLDDKKKKAILGMVRRLPQYHFIIRTSKKDTTSHAMLDGISNADLVEWLPQAQLLAHPRLKLFIMHGGINGLIEAMHRAVPVVVIPIFADQFRNGRNVEKRGVGKVILKREVSEETLVEAVEEITKDPRYKKNALRMQKLMLEKPFSPEKRLISWTEFAINNGVLEELHIEGARLNTIVYFNLDVFAAISLIILTLLYILYRTAKCLLLRGRKLSKKIKQQ